jgi:glycerophosphoryl diester phosphodiesterase
MIHRLLSITGAVAIAHRGGARLRPENTLAAFDNAVALGCDGIECDVHLSRDGEPVVIHDATLDRTTDRTGPVAALSAAELERVDAGYRFGAADGFPFRGLGHGVPRLAQLLDRHPTLPVVVEIKGDWLEVAERVLAVIRDANAESRVIVAGFSQRVVDIVRRLAPEVPTSASQDEVTAGVRAASAGEPIERGGWRVYQAPIRHNGQPAFDGRFVAAARAVGIPVHVWVVDEPDEMRQLLDWGVTGIISDRPAVAVAVTGVGRGFSPGGSSRRP